MLDLNADEVLKLAEIGCQNTEIAHVFGCSPDTIERRFAGELAKGRANLKTKLRRLQFGLAEKGNLGMLIWLGTQYLGQAHDGTAKKIVDAMNDAGLSPEQIMDMIRGHKERVLEIECKRSFQDFCLKANYHAPLPKQLEMRQFAFEKTVPRMILGSRGYGKTDYLTILGVAYDVYLNGHATSNLIISKSKLRNTAMMGEIAMALRLNGVELEKENSGCVRVAGLVGKDHSVEAITIKTSMRGRHPKRIIMDDPVTEEDVSEAMRVTVKRKYNEAMKLVTDLLVIGQPAHKLDLYAELRPMVETMELPHGTIPELDHDLEAQRLAGVDESSIQASYHLKILSDGTMPFEKIRTIAQFPISDSAVAFIDPSFEGGDYTAMSIVRQYMEGVAVVGFTWKRAWNHCLDELVVKLKDFGVKKLCFEANALGDQPVIMLRQLLKDTGIGVAGRKSNTNKHSRIMAAGAFAHMIHLSDQSDKTYRDQVIKYEYKVKNDDAPDSLASCLEWIGLIRGKI